MTQGNLETLAPTTREVVVGERTITIRPVTLGKLPKLLATVEPIIGALVGSTSASSPQAGQGAGDPDYLDVNLGELDLLRLYIAHGQRINDALPIVTDLTPAEVDKLELDKALELFKAMFEVNRDFFTQRVLPLLGLSSQQVPAPAPADPPAE
jgi:hypothetical protein